MQKGPVEIEPSRELIQIGGTGLSSDYPHQDFDLPTQVYERGQHPLVGRVRRQVDPRVTRPRRQAAPAGAYPARPRAGA